MHIMPLSDGCGKRLISDAPKKSFFLAKTQYMYISSMIAYVNLQLCILNNSYYKQKTDTVSLK